MPNPSFDSPLPVSIFTATFNRKEKLARLYKSLVDQTTHCFEWIIIDDGSMDGTDKQVVRWQIDNALFPIIYVWQPNAGKHVAHNRAVMLARGVYFGIIDSDDTYQPDAIENLLATWNDLPNRNQPGFANVEGLTVTMDGKLIGSPFPKDIYDSDNFSIRWQRARAGDTKGLYRAEVLRQFLFPVDVGSPVTEAIVWHRIARHYKTRFINTVIGVNEYLPDGLSHTQAHRVMDNASVKLMLYSEMLDMPQRIPPRLKARYFVNYLRLSMLVNRRAQTKRISPFLAMTLRPLAWMLAKHDRWHSHGTSS